MRRRDLVRESLLGLRFRLLRSALCALGIAIGAAAVVCVVAIPASTQATLLARLGTDGNLLTVATGRSFNGAVAALPESAPAMIRHLGGVLTAASVGQLPNLVVRRSTAIPVQNTNGIALLAADPTMRDTLNLTVSTGRFLDDALAHYPTVVLGSAAARSLGIQRIDATTQVYLGPNTGQGGQYAVVAGLLAPVPLAPELDTAALIGIPAARTSLGFTGEPTRIYLRADPDRVSTVWPLLAPTANPRDPGDVTVARPSDLLVARASTRGAFLGLALGLGAVALLAGGIGVANLMVVAVLERRPEIGIRRALGATRLFVAAIFLIEATLLCLLGSLTGVAIGVLITITYTTLTGSTVVLPLSPLAAALGASLLIGLIAGSYPALRAAHLSPTEALRT